MVELQRNQRDEIGHQHVKAHYAAASVHVWSHLIHPGQWRHKSDRHYHRGLHLLPFSFLCTQCHRFFNIPFQLMCKDEGDKANGLLLLPNDMTIWTGKGFKSQLAWSHQCFKDLGSWSGWSLNSEPPAQQIRTLSTGLTGQQMLQCQASWISIKFQWLG